MSAGDPRVARTASEASGLALLTSSGLDRATCPVQSRPNRLFSPSTIALMADLATWAGLEGAGCHRLRRRRLLGKLRFPVLDDGRKSEICEHIRNLRFLRTAADASTERAVSSRAQRAKASESQPAQRSEQDCLARRRAKRAARVTRAKRA